MCLKRERKKEWKKKKIYPKGKVGALIQVASVFLWLRVRPDVTVTHGFVQNRKMWIIGQVASTLCCVSLDSLHLRGGKRTKKRVHTNRKNTVHHACQADKPHSHLSWSHKKKTCSTSSTANISLSRAFLLDFLFSSNRYFTLGLRFLQSPSFLRLPSLSFLTRIFLLFSCPFGLAHSHSN